MDPIWWVLIIAGVFFLLMIISKRLGFKFPLALGVLAALASILFRFTSPSSPSTPDEHLSAKTNDLYSLIALLFTVFLFANAFILFRAKKMSKQEQDHAT